MSQVIAAAELDRPRFFTAEFWGIELLVMLYAAILIVPLCVPPYLRLTLDGERVDVRVVAAYDGGYDVVLGDLVVRLDTSVEGIRVGDTTSVLVDRDDPSSMVLLEEVTTLLGLSGLALVAAAIYPVARCCVLRRSRRRMIIIETTPTSDVTESVAPRSVV